MDRPRPGPRGCRHTKSEPNFDFSPNGTQSSARHGESGFGNPCSHGALNVLVMSVCQDCSAFQLPIGSAVDFGVLEPRSYSQCQSQAPPLMDTTAVSLVATKLLEHMAMRSQWINIVWWRRRHPMRDDHKRCCVWH